MPKPLDNVAFSAQDGSLRCISPKIERNSSCPINFDKKFKKCCGADGSNFCKKLLGDYLNELQKAQEQLTKNDQIS